MKANLKVLGDRPQRPFNMGAKVYLATRDQIMNLLGIDNPSKTSVSLGKLLGYLPKPTNLINQSHSSKNSNNKSIKSNNQILIKSVTSRP